MLEVCSTTLPQFILPDIYEDPRYKKSLQQKIYIDNCDFVFINPEQKNGEQFNKIKTITKLSIKNKC